MGARVSPEFTRPVRVQTRKLRADHRGSLLLQDSSPDFYPKEAKTSQKLPHCPGLTCSQEAESHTAEEPGAHGSIRNPGLLLAGGGAPGVSGVKC